MKTRPNRAVEVSDRLAALEGTTRFHGRLIVLHTIVIVCVAVVMWVGS